MGDPDAEVKIRNLPIGSDNYYICYLISAHVQAVKVEKDKEGEIIAVHDRFLKENFQKEADYFIDFVNGDATNRFFDEDTYPTPTPSNLDIYAFEDELIGFKPSLNYLQKAEKAKAAVAELKNEKGQIFLDHYKVDCWVEKYRSFYWSLQLDWNYAELQEFQWMYFKMKWLNEDTYQLPRVEYAMSEYVPMDDEWFDRAQRLGIHYFYSGHWNFEVFDTEPFMLKEIDREMYLYGEVFKQIYEFTEVYERERMYNMRNDVPF